MAALVCQAALGILAGSAAGGEGAYVTRLDDQKGMVIGNRCLELGLAISDGKCAAVRLVNKLTRRTVPLTADDFAIGVDGRAAPIRAADLTFRRALHRAIPGGQCLKLSYDAEAGGLGMDVIYELGDGDFFLRRHLELASQDKLALRRVDVWLAGVKGTCSHQGFGEPVFLEDTFWGVEFPGADNAYADGQVRLSHHPGRTVQGPFVSKTAVLGVAEAGQVARRFRQYVQTFQVTLRPGASRGGPASTSKTFQATPDEKARLFVNYNTWWTLMPPTEANCLALIETFRKNLFEPHGESFDTFTIDDGWDDKETLWKIRSDRFPRGFAPLVEPLKSMRANLGLWLSPSSGYGHAPHLAKQGYEHNSNPWYCCQSGPKYRRDIVQVVTGLAKTYDMAFFKFDGFCASCEAAGHGHLLGAYAREANIDAYIELMQAARAARPGVYLDPTCGMWLSPWWLRYCDSIWGSVSGDYPDVIVPAPIIRDSATTTRDAVFRQRCREHPGFPPSAIEHLGIIVITPEKWQDNAMAVVGRGARLLTLYVNPQFFTKGKADWAFLASLLKWTRHNAATLGHTALVGGDPLNREWYGFAHLAGPGGIICLRNPFIAPQKVSLALDESIGWPWGRAGASMLGGPFVARIVYPREEALRSPLHHGDPIELTLQGYETVLVEIKEAQCGDLPPQGIRAHERARAGNRVEFEVYGRPGQKAAVSYPGRPKKAELDGQALTPVFSNGGTVCGLSLPFPGEQGTCRVEGGSLVLKEGGAASRLEGKCVALVPQGVQAAMHLLVDPRGGAAGMECSARVAGKDAAVRAVRSGGDQAHSKHPWTWFEFDLPAGKNDVAVTIKPSKGGGFTRAEVGWWLWVEHPLQKKTLTLEFDKPLPPAKPEPLPLPINMETERQIITIQAVKVFTAPRVWPKADAPSAWLDELPPDDVTLGWGKLQTNQSVWEKPMTIAGRKFARGLGTHADSRIVYDLTGGGFRSFRCLVGRDEHAGDGRVVFQVLVDGKKAFDSGPVTKSSAAKPVTVDLAGARELELRTLDGGDGISGDHGDWAEARLER